MDFLFLMLPYVYEKGAFLGYGKWMVTCFPLCGIQLILRSVSFLHHCLPKIR